MRIEMRAQISGTRNGEDWPAKGGTIDVPDDEAAQLIGQGMAVPAAADEEVEAAADGTSTETATVKNTPAKRG